MAQNYDPRIINYTQNFFSIDKLSITTMWLLLICTLWLPLRLLLYSYSKSIVPRQNVAQRDIEFLMYIKKKCINETHTHTLDNRISVSLCFFFSLYLSLSLSHSHLSVYLSLYHALNSQTWNKQFMVENHQKLLIWIRLPESSGPKFILRDVTSNSI